MEKRKKNPNTSKTLIRDGWSCDHQHGGALHSNGSIPFRLKNDKTSVKNMLVNIIFRLLWWWGVMDFSLFFFFFDKYFKFSYRIQPCWTPPYIVLSNCLIYWLKSCHHENWNLFSSSLGFKAASHKSLY